MIDDLIIDCAMCSSVHRYINGNIGTSIATSMTQSMGRWRNE
jgi:hypothetical protein